MLTKLTFFLFIYYLLGLNNSYLRRSTVYKIISKTHSFHVLNVNKQICLTKEVYLDNKEWVIAVNKKIHKLM